MSVLRAKEHTISLKKQAIAKRLLNFFSIAQYYYDTQVKPTQTFELIHQKDISQNYFHIHIVPTQNLPIHKKEYDKYDINGDLAYYEWHPNVVLEASAEV